MTHFGVWLPCRTLNTEGKVGAKQNGEAVQASGEGPRSGPDPLVISNDNFKLPYFAPLQHVRN